MSIFKRKERATQRKDPLASGTGLEWLTKAIDLIARAAFNIIREREPASCIIECDTSHGMTDVMRGAAVSKHRYGYGWL